MSSTEINTTENHQFNEPVLKLTVKAVNQLGKLYSEQLQLKQSELGLSDAHYGIRVGVIGGGCSGLSYKIDFSEKKKKM